ncbi:MAG: ribosome small subunit-dependent GTPase A [Pseudomonadales bacterium]|nr:ribosome small subunit-dependent GTPase A [Pseudomonadales bacterium]MCP5185119.1 ribosome small subunit-dependent GTPase A [Pseudomonadales bacterium]
MPLGGRWFHDGVDARPTVGDWVRLDAALTRAVELLPRRNLVRRREVHTGGVQAVAANVDTVLVVTACNEEFNTSRLERFLTLASDAGVPAVVVLTKPDLTPDPAAYVGAVRSLEAGLPVFAVNARNKAEVRVLQPWLGEGLTVLMIGSSGVGKSTLLNSLAGEDRQRTGAIRQADGKGRHTTSHRSLHALPDGTLVIDSPGVRELGLLESDGDAASHFDDIESLARSCRFSDCRHQSEPGCAVSAALAAGTLDARRLASYRKLAGERAAPKITAPGKTRGARRGKGKLTGPLD